MQALIGPLASGVIGAIVSAIGVYVAITNRLTKTETIIENLAKQVEKHNEVIERTYQLEADVHTQWRRLDELRVRMDRAEDKLT